MKDESLMEHLREFKALIIDSKANKDGRTGYYPKSADYGSFLSERLDGAKQSCCTLRDSLVQDTMSSHNSRTSVTYKTSSDKINVGRRRLGKPVSAKNSQISQKFRISSAPLMLVWNASNSYFPY